MLPQLRCVHIDKAVSLVNLKTPVYLPGFFYGIKKALNLSGLLLLLTLVVYFTYF